MNYTITYRILNDEENDKNEVMTMNADFSRTLALLRQEKGISQRKAAKEAFRRRFYPIMKMGSASRGLRLSKRHAIFTMFPPTICSGARSTVTAA
mgnify:CR=1 FL=1